MKYEAAVELPLSASDYFEEKDSAAFLALLAKMQNLKDMSVVNTVMDEAGNDVVHVITIPDLDAYVPKSLQRFITFDPAVHDYMTYAKGKVEGPTYEFSTLSTLPALGEKQFANKYNVRIEPTGPSSCKQTIWGDVNIKIFGVGKTAEKIASDSIVKGYTLMKEVLTRWCEFREKVLAAGGRAALLEGRPDLTVIPKDAVDVFKKPYADCTGLDGGVTFGEQAGKAGSAEKLERLVTRYFDAVDDVDNVDELNEILSEGDELTRAATQHDLMNLIEEAQQAAQQEEAADADSAGPASADDPDQPPLSTFQRSYTYAAGVKTREFVNSQASKAKEDWHGAFVQWKSFWDDVEMEKPKTPNVAVRIRLLLSHTYRLGLIRSDDGDEEKPAGGVQRGAIKDRLKNHHKRVRQGIVITTKKMQTDVEKAASSVKSLLSRGGSGGSLVVSRGASGANLGSGDDAVAPRTGSISAGIKNMFVRKPSSDSTPT